MDKSLEIVKENLISLGFFKYASAGNFSKTIDKTFENYKNDGVIKFDYEDLNRLAYIDAEDIFEQNGLKSFAEGLVNFFKALGVGLELGECIEEFDGDKYTKRSVVINDKIYDTSIPDVHDWATGFNSGFRLIDTLLLEYNIPDRLFGLFMDESSTLIILDEVLFGYLTELVPEDEAYRPIDIKAMMIEHFGV